MSGHRRRTGADPAGGAGGVLGLPSRRVRPARRRAVLATRFARAVTDLERVVCGFDYFRGAASRRHPRPDAAAEVLATVTGQLIAAGDELLRLQAAEPLRPGKDTST